MIKELTRYFRSALIAKNQGVIDFKNSDNGFEIISKENFYKGVVDLEILERISSCDNEDDESKKKNEELLNIIIIAKTIKSNIIDGKNIGDNLDELTGVLYIPAVINLEGKLKFSRENNKWPWVPREFLEPMIEPQLSIGNIDDVDKFFENTTDQRSKITDWNEYVTYIKEFYKKITNSDFQDNYINAGNSKMELEKNVYITLDNTINASYNIEELYEDILKNDSEKQLYEKFMKPTIEEPKTLIQNDSYIKMIEHKGQMGGEYPLADSQREAINHLSELNEGDILAVSGPPGTGKTTLLQSIVSDIYVEHALKQRNAPIVVASSTNNQAVTNIIDSFGSIAPIGIRNLEQRWIEGINSFAVYFPSKNKKDGAEKKGYHCTSNKGDSFALNIDTDDNLINSEEKMLKYASEYFNEDIKEVSVCKEIIYSNLTIIEAKKKKVIGLLQAIKELIGDLTLNEYVGTLESEILKYMQIEENCIEEIKINNKRITEYRNRVDEWIEIYKKIPWYMKLFKMFKPIRKKIYTYLNVYKEPSEKLFLSDNFLLDEIINRYLEKIEETNKNILNLEEKIEANKNIIQTIKNNKIHILKIRNNIRNEFMELKKYNCDIWYSTNDKKSEEQRKKVDKYLDECSIIQLNELIDTRLRYIQFWLAVHYYECRWLEKENYITEKQRGNNYKNVIESLYTRLAMITPCMVMTFFMLPKQFKVYNANEKVKTYLYNFIDLLIVDEAGQVSPEIAAASFALAKKSIVVGDEKQIPPVWGIARALDKSLAIRNNVINKMITFETLIKTGQNCSKSSVMKVAMNSCCYNKYDKGLFLSEHRRCYNEIIKYCNELVYKGKLKAYRGYGKEDRNYPINQYPHMGYKNIEVTNSGKKGSSRVNFKEAEEIARWLSINYEKLVNAYIYQNNSIKENEIIAIITPFKAQVAVLKNKLNLFLSDKAINVHVGTVHTFQGAERKIIILSTVYGSSDGCFFINKNDSLMNVAVSRAKDAFWIFGARECLDKNGTSASSLLRKYVNIEIE
jgi:DNA polymerase III delta prime subunit